MQMDLRTALRMGNVGVVAGLIVMAVGLGIVGLDPSDTELQIVCWSAIGVGLSVLVGLAERYERRRRRSRR